MSRLINKWNDEIRNQAISIIRNLTTENGLSFDELGVLSSFLLIERTENSKLAHYEDLEDEGRLIELPCKPHELVYAAHKVFPIRQTMYCCNAHIVESIEAGYAIGYTRESAEAKLAEMEGAK